MKILENMLDFRKYKIWGHFQSLRTHKAPEGLSGQELYHLGLQKGYGEGLIDGVDLGIDVGLDTPLYDIPETDPLDWIEH